MSPAIPWSRLTQSWPAALSLAFLLLAAVPAAAQSSDTDNNDTCPTWFPDFRCDRQGRYEGFVVPVTMPYLFEDPFITTGVQLIGIWHDFPEESIFDGGDAYVLALQARIAITDRLAFIATKDGVTWLRPGLSLLDDEDGIMDITFGFKYALIDRPEDKFILSPHIRYEIPLGDEDLFQGQGDGVLIPGISAGWGFGDVRMLGDFGMQIPFDGDKNSTSIFYNLHVAWVAADHFVPFVELNGMHWTDSGDGSSIVETNIGDIPVGLATTVLGNAPFEGTDVANLGNVGVKHNNLLTMGFGARVPFKDHWSLGAAWEIPVTGRKDIFEQRVTTSLTFDF